MGTRVTGDKDRAAMYNGTSGIAFGPTYTGVGNSKEELLEFLAWLSPKSPKEFNNSQLETLMIGFKVDTGLIDGWEDQVQAAEEILGRDIDS